MEFSFKLDFSINHLEIFRGYKINPFWNTFYSLFIHSGEVQKSCPSVDRKKLEVGGGG